MAQTIIEVNTSNLKSDVDRISEELKAIRSDADQIRTILGTLNGMWDGDAKTAFADSVGTDLDALLELLCSMEDLVGQTDMSRTEYEKCESTVVDIVDSIRV